MNVHRKNGESGDQEIVEQIIDGLTARLGSAYISNRSTEMPTLGLGSPKTLLPHIINDSDCSWDDQDELEVYYHAMEQRLEALKDPVISHFFLTKPLPRKRIHGTSSVAKPCDYPKHRRPKDACH